jgi:hypothetical protein
MEAIRIEFQPSIKEKILELLSSFSSDEVKIEFEDPNFAQNKRMLDKELEKINNGTAECCTLEEMDAFLDKTFFEYDSKIK